MDMDIYRTPAGALDGLVMGSLRPRAEFVGTARRALGALGAALRERDGRAAAPTWRVLKIAKVGSRWGGSGNLWVFICKQGQSSEEAARHMEMGERGQGGVLSVFSFI